MNSCTCNSLKRFFHGSTSGNYTILAINFSFFSCIFPSRFKNKAFQNVTNKDILLAFLIRFS